MKVVVYGLWHLGSITAACLAAAGLQTIGLDPSASLVAQLNNGGPPLSEPGLADLLKDGLQSGHLSFSSNPAVAQDAQLVWVTFDTPVDEDDHADPDFVMDRIVDLLPHVCVGAVIVISSQLPVGSTATLAARFERAGRADVLLAYSPENLRLGVAIDAFRRPDRIIVGVQASRKNAVLESVLSRFSDNLIWMSWESSEMVKHSLNAFLATSVTFINEIAAICEQVGARAADVEEGLKSEARIGRKAYLRPGAGFAGGTLARDVRFLEQVAHLHDVATPVLRAILPSNAIHQRWPLRRVVERFGPDLRGRRMAVLGLTYKPGTDTLRRSAAVELCRALADKGAELQVFDPVVREISPDLAVKMAMRGSLIDALRGADAAIVATEWPQFKNLTAAQFAEHMAFPLLIDQNGFLAKTVGADGRIDYVQFGGLR